jgi:threonine/homoserine/homoserine lactone efflux protein
MMILFTFVLGLAINAVGYVPPGNINLTLAQITVNRGMRQAWSFILAFSVVEVFFTFGMMRFIRWTSSDINDDTEIWGFPLGVLVDSFMIVLLLAMGVLAWTTRNKAHKPDSDSRKGSVAYGAFLATFNPLQIPFWLFCGNFIVIRNWIDTDYLSLVIFSLGSASGAGLALYGYAHFARYIQDKFALSSALINKSIAIFLFSFAAFLLLRQLFL